MRIRPSLFREEILSFDAPPLLTIEDLLEHTGIPVPAHEVAVCWFGGVKIERRYWTMVRPKAGTIVLFAIMPEDSRTAILIGGSLAIAIAAAATGGLLAGPGAAALGLTAGGLGATALGAGGAALVSVGGAMLLNALVPPPNTGADDQESFERVAIGAVSNRIQPYEAIPVVMGHRRVTPAFGARPYSEVRSGHLYSTYLFAISAGNTALGDYRFGDTPIADFDDVEVIGHDGRGESASSNAIYSLYNADRFEDRLNVALTFADSPFVRSSPERTREITLNFFAPAGPYFINSKGQTRWYEIAITIEFRQLGQAAWNVWISSVGLGNDRPSPQWWSFTLPLPVGQWEIRVTRRSFDNNDPSQRNDEIVWFSMVSVQDTGGRQLFDPNVAVLAIRIRDQGSLGAFNCIGHSAGRVFEGGIWGFQLTSNPASMFIRVLQGLGALFFVPDSQIDFDALGSWYLYCKALGYEFNGVIETERPVREVLDMICARGRATWDLVDGKYTVILDRPQDLPVTALLTPRNISNLRGSANFEPIPPVVRVRFADRNNNYEPDERIVFDDGFDDFNADFSKAEVLDLVNSITHSDHAFREGRRFLAHRRLRRERFTCSIGLEHVMMRRGHKVLLQHWTALIGIADARIKALTQAATITAITLDQTVTMEVGFNYGVRIRTVAGGSASFNLHQVNLVVGDTKTLTFTTPIGLSSIAVGDLVSFGRLNAETSEMLVIARDPTVDGATIVLTHAAPGIEAAEFGVPIPPWNPNITQTGKRLQVPAVPQIIAVAIDALAVSGHPDVLRKVSLVVHLARPAASKPVPQFINIRSRIVDSGAVWRIDTFPGDTLQCTIPTNRDGVRYEVQAQAIAAQGGATLASAWSPTVQKFVPVVNVTPAVLATVHHLELLGQANDNVFGGRDPTFVWTLSSGVGGVSLDQITGGLNSFVDPTFGFYEVAIYGPDPNTLRRIERIQGPQYTYIWSKNVEDAQRLGFPLPSSTLRITVTLVDKFNHRSNTAQLSVLNPAPAAPAGLVVTGGVGVVFVQIAKPADTDFAGIIVYATKTSGFTPAVGTEVARSGDIRTSFNATGLTYVRVAAFDEFRDNPDLLNISSEIQVEPLDPNDISAQPTFQFDGITLVPNPANNTISWDTGQAIITQSNGQVLTESIAAGAAAWPGLRLYIYYQRGANALQVTTDITQATGLDRAAVGAYGGGSNLYDLAAARTRISATDILLAGTVGAGVIATDHAIITQGAQIASAVINTAHIGFAQITAAHIQDLSVDTLKIRGQAVTTSRLGFESATAARWAVSGAQINLNANLFAAVISANCPTKGGPVEIKFFAQISTSSPSSAVRIDCQVLRDGILLSDVRPISVINPNSFGGASFFLVDFPGGEGLFPFYEIRIQASFASSVFFRELLVIGHR